MLYLISDGDSTKIGISKNPRKRLAQLQTGHPKKLSLIQEYDVPHYYEKRLHKQLWMFRLRGNGEWFRLSPSSCLTFIEDYFASIKKGESQCN